MGVIHVANALYPGTQVMQVSKLLSRFNTKFGVQFYRRSLTGITLEFTMRITKDERNLNKFYVFFYSVLKITFVYMKFFNARAGNGNLMAGFTRKSIMA